MITWLAALLAGCKQYPLSDVPISGGTASQRALVRAIVDEFEAATGGGRVTLSAVHLNYLPNGLAGDYERATHRVRVSSGLSDRDLQYTTRHELCHALDFADELAAEPGTIWDDISDKLFGNGVPGVTDTYASKNARSRRSEALAMFCEQGPLYAQLIADPCADDPDGAADIADGLLDQVWWGPEPVPVTNSKSSDAVVWDRAVADVIPYPSPAMEPGFVVLDVDSENLVDCPTVDLYTGVTVDEFYGRVFSPDYSGWASFTEGPWAWKAEASESTGLDGGPDALLGRVYLWHLEWSAYRRFWSPDGQEWMLAGCAREGENIFYADDTLWTFWVEGDQAMWTPLEP
ncbi:MAG: hypothetical protein ABMA64_37920 [Myxococcota bacterium]